MHAINQGWIHMFWPEMSRVEARLSFMDGLPYLSRALRPIVDTGANMWD